MPLNIECENGHKLVCPDSLAGSSVICPKCGSRVDVSARNVAKGGRAFSESAKSSLSGMHKDAAAAMGLAESDAKSDEVTFACPNGHRLTGPRTLQGRAGECPKCGVRFRVSVASERTEPPESSDEDEISLEGIEEIDMTPPTTPPSPAKEHATAAVFAASAQMGGRTIVDLFAELWRERAHGGLIELHLDNGEIISPDWWSERRSTEEVGLFALQIDEKTYEIQAILWSHLRRIGVRRLAELPGGVFEGI